MKDFKLANSKDFKGYINKADITNIDGVFLTEGSQNVVSTDEGRIGTRKGFTLFGAAGDATQEPIVAEFTWKTARGEDIMIRARNDASTTGTLEFYTGDIFLSGA
ncbi:unnamed protein product, partial [marine sediment metagenome]